MILNGIIDEQNRLWVKIRVAGYHGGRYVLLCDFKAKTLIIKEPDGGNPEENTSRKQ